MNAKGMNDIVFAGTRLMTLSENTFTDGTK